ncbi:MAG: cytochrome d ubiquinol oxidase subunit II [Alicyclobacillaceae bacterium]|nr:cytochrome d ubiquinol oxidase subunit II [Alicyclobacillaceae bacterium]
MAGSIDFGAGFWSMVYRREKDTRASVIANRYLSPLWEVTNVFLVLFAVALVGMFPSAAYALGSVLLVPGNLILILLTIRTVFLVYTHAVHRHQSGLRTVSGITGLVIPALLMTVFPVAQGGFLRHTGGHWTLSLASLFSHWTTYSYIALGLTSELYLSSLFLADYARVAGDDSAFQVYRRNALWLGPVTMLAALFTLWAIPSSAAWLRRDLAGQSTLFIASAACFLVAMAVLWRGSDVRRRWYRLSVVASVAQYALAMIAYGRAHLPYLVYPSFTIANSFTNMEMFRAAVLVLLIGIAILFPGFVWFWRLFLENKGYVGKLE